MDENPQNPVNTQPTVENQPQQTATDITPLPAPTQPITEIPLTPTPPTKKSNNMLLIGFVFLLLVSLIGSGYLYLQNQKKETSPNVTSLVKSPTATPDPTLGWQTYTNSKYGFSLKIPNNFQAPPETTNLGVFGNNIFFNVSKNSEPECTGDCPVIEKTEKVQINNYEVTKFEGWKGEIGGCVAMQYITHEFNKDTDYISISLNATTCNNNGIKTENIVEINNNDLEVYYQILSTLRFNSGL